MHKQGNHNRVSSLFCCDFDDVKLKEACKEVIVTNSNDQLTRKRRLVKDVDLAVFEHLPYKI